LIFPIKEELGMKDSRHHIHGLQKKVLQDAKHKLASELEKNRQEEEAAALKASEFARYREGEQMPVPDYIVEPHIPRSVRLKRQWNIHQKWH